jgi:hypothetical protein
MKKIIKQLLREEFGYRAGDLINKAELLKNTKGIRGTGHFGTGFYFFGSEDSAKKYAEITGNRQVSKIDLSKYKLLKVTNDSLGYKLHDELKKWDGFNITDIKPMIKQSLINHLKFDIESNKSGLKKSYDLINDIYDYLENLSDKVIDLDDIEDLLVNVFKNDDEITLPSIIGNIIYKYVGDDKIDKAINDIRKKIDNFIDTMLKNKGSIFKNVLYKDLEQKLSKLGYIVNQIDPSLSGDVEGTLAKALMMSLRRDPYLDIHGSKTTLGTELIKSLGYNGIDVRGTGLDNSVYGSVLYDV